MNLDEMPSELATEIILLHKNIFPKTKEISEKNIRKILSFTPKKNIVADLSKLANIMFKLIIPFVQKKQVSTHFTVGLSTTPFSSTKTLLNTGGIVLFEASNKGSHTISGVYALPNQFPYIGHLFFNLHSKIIHLELTKRKQDKINKDFSDFCLFHQIKKSNALELISEFFGKKILKDESLMPFIQENITTFTTKLANHKNALHLKQEADRVRHQINTKIEKSKQQAILNVYRSIVSTSPIFLKPFLPTDFSKFDFIKTSVLNILSEKCSSLKKAKEDNNFALVETNLLNFEQSINESFVSLLLPTLFHNKMFAHSVSQSIHHKNQLNFIPKNDVYSLFAKIFKEFSLHNDLTELELSFSLLLDTLIEKNNSMKEQHLSEIKNLKAKSTITNLEDFYSTARLRQREIHCYFGPTNSGKTHFSIQEFLNAKKAIYLAPLRLLAREIFDENFSKVNISLITGEEKILHPEQTHVTATIEMLDLNEEYDVAIIDEIQMIGDWQRGNAWTRALMGVNAKKVIVVGSGDSSDIVDYISQRCSEPITTTIFERKNPLEFFTSKACFTKDDLQKGDAIICFSRKKVLEFKELITSLGLSTSVIYGALPPLTRIAQANAFNNGETDILISTDAIGYGLNLNIKRILFSGVNKFNGEYVDTIEHSLFRQISGRAGRFNKHDVGFVQFLDYNDRFDEHSDFLRLVKNINKPLPIIRRALFFPEFEHILEFSKIKEFNNNLLPIIQTYYNYFSNPGGRLVLRDSDAYFHIADIIDRTAPNLSLRDKYKLAFAPVKPYDQVSEKIFKDFLKYELDKKDSFCFSDYYTTKTIFSKQQPLHNLEEISQHLSLIQWLLNHSKKIPSTTENLTELSVEISLLIDKMLLQKRKP